MPFLRQVGEEVGGVVRTHLLEDVGGGLGWQRLENVDLVLGGELLDDVRRPLVVERGEDPGAIARGQLLDDMRDVRRMEGR